MARKMKVTVLMAGCYEIVKGSRIDFHWNGDVYLSSAGGMAFGIAMLVPDGDEEDVKQLGTDFSGIVVKCVPQRRLMDVMVKVRREQKV